MLKNMCFHTSFDTSMRTILFFFRVSIQFIYEIVDFVTIDGNDVFCEDGHGSFGPRESTKCAN